MKCAMCNRPLTTPAASVPTRAGPMAYGPKCAKRAGLVRPKERKPRARVEFMAERDRRTVDWVEELAA